MIKIIKVGGNIIDNPTKLKSFLKDFALLDGQKILIHGGGKLATDLCVTLGIESKMVDGKRITDSETLKVVTMVYAGLINKNIVAKLQAFGCNAIGLSGADMNIIQAKKRVDTKIDWGFVGDITPNTLKAEKFEFFLQNQITPIFSAITHDGEGNLLNTNADTIASVIASTLANAGHKVSLVYTFEKKGVLVDVNDNSTIIKKITFGSFNELKEKKIVHSGMIPKLENAFKSIAEGVQEVKICMAEDLHDFENAGTTISLH